MSNDLVKVLEASLSVLQSIDGKLSQVIQLNERSSSDTGESIGIAPLSPTAAVASAALSKKSGESKGDAAFSSRLSAQLNTLTRLTDPTQSKVIAGIDAAKASAQFAAGFVGEKLGGEAGRLFANSAVTGALNLSGANQQINDLKNAKSALFSRISAATDAGIVYSEDQLARISNAEIRRQNRRSQQLNRAVSAFDGALVEQGLQAVEKNFGKETVDKLTDISKLITEGIAKISGGVTNLRRGT